VRKKRFVYPRRQDINLVLNALRLIPMDYNLELSWRNSHAGNPNLHVKSQTNEIEWSVDIYPNNFFFVRLDLRMTQVCHSVPSLVGYICRMLRVKPVSNF